MFHIVAVLWFSSIMFPAVYQFWSNKNDMIMMNNSQNVKWHKQ